MEDIDHEVFVSLELRIHAVRSGLTQHIIELSRESLSTVVTVTELHKQRARIKSPKISHHHGKGDPNIAAGHFLEPSAPSLENISIIWTPTAKFEFGDVIPLFSDDHPWLRSVYLSA